MRKTLLINSRRSLFMMRGICMSQTKDMTIGNPSKLILAFGMPLLAGNLLQQLYNMVDTIVVGRGVGRGCFSCCWSYGVD